MHIKVDLIAPPFSGHLNPLIELALPLRTRGFDVRFITGPRKVPLLRQLGFSAVPLLPESPQAMEGVANTARPVGSNPFHLLRQLKENLRILPAIKDEIRGLITGRGTDIVVADFVAVPAGIVCEELGIPWITTIPTPFAIEALGGTPSYLGGWGHGRSPAHRVRDAAGRLVVRGFKRGVGWLCRRELRDLPYTVYRPDGQENAYSPYRILGLGMGEFEFPRPWPPQFTFIGPCCLSPEPLFPVEFPITPHQRKVLVTLGTHLEWAKPRLIEDVKVLADACADVAFVVSFGRPERRQSGPVLRAGNIFGYEYIPYDPFLREFDAVIHHGGAGITYNAIKFQKPSVVVPHDYDQFDFAARIAHHGLGIKVKALSSAETVRALRKALNSDMAKGLAAMHQHWPQYNPAERLEEEICRLVPGSR